jgi:23S rRNA (cytosine1962-C5)-methyltransferase
LVLNLYSMGLSALVARSAVRGLFGTPTIEQFGELYFTDRGSKELPLGVYYRMTR